MISPTDRAFGGVVLLTVLAVASVHGAVGPTNNNSPIFPRFTENHGDALGAKIDLPSVQFRLPNKIVPRHYKLDIRPILNEGEANRFTAPGAVTITVQCLEATSDLVLHAAELNIDENSIRVWPIADPATPLTPVTARLNTENETLTVGIAETLTVGAEYAIYIEYVAEIADPLVRMNGIYRSSYVTESGETRFLATTQFSRTRAFRKMLPSFDEPSQKAVFEISVGRQDPYHSLSNMDIRTSAPITGMPGWTWDHYHPTPIMAPTIIAIIVSDFDSETAPPELFNPDKPCKIWGPPPEIKDGGGEFAAQAAARTLKYFQDYFEIDYELPKIDSAAIPDFAAGAMENWGLNTYRVMYLIWRDGVHTMAEKFRVANILGHELAHQYWGNLVTHAWWNDWWLTEGYASYFEYRSVDAIHPDYEAINRLITSDVQPAMEFDAGSGSVPIHGNVTDEFVENPSAINYSKGASLVGMIRNFLTEEVFRKAVSFYLAKQAYEAVDQDVHFNDIHEYLAANNALPSNGKTFKQIMDTWTLQTSFPLVRVSRAGPSFIYISQEKFENLDTRDQAKQSSGLWDIPVTYLSQTNPAYNDGNMPPQLWVDSSVLVMTHAINTNQWLLFNPDGYAYYRVLYDAHFAGLLKIQLESDITSIPIGSRSMIVDDYFASAYQGYTSMNSALDITKFIGQETNFNVWAPYIKHLRKAYELLSDDAAAFDPFKNFILTSMSTALTDIGYEQVSTEGAMTTIFRVQLFDWACPMFDPGCVAEANRLLTLWRAEADPAVIPIPVDVRPNIYCASVATSTNGNFVFLLARYDATKDALIRNALGCTVDNVQLQSLLDKVLSDTTMSSVDRVAILQRIAMNSVGRPLLMTFLEARFAELIVPTAIGPSGISEVITALGNYYSSTVALTRLETFVNNNEAALAPVMTQIDASLAKIRANAIWMMNFGNSVATWMANN